MELVRLEPVPNKLAQEADGDIVFVHGLGGDGYATWTADKNDEAKYWPRWIADDFKTWQVWSLYYPARLTKWTTNDHGRALPLVRRANSLLNLLVAEGFGQRPIVFITHSLGGVITKQFLMSSATGKVEDDEPIARHTVAVVFLATPHQGANLANLGLALARVRLWGVSLSWVLRWSPHIRDLRSNDANLEGLFEWFKNNANSLNIQVLPMAEQYPTLGIERVVPEWSANPGIKGVKLIPVDADHFSIAKPNGTSSTIHKRVREFLRKVTAQQTDLGTATASKGFNDLYDRLTDAWSQLRAPSKNFERDRDEMTRAIQALEKTSRYWDSAAGNRAARNLIASEAYGPFEMWYLPLSKCNVELVGGTAAHLVSRQVARVFDEMTSHSEFIGSESQEN